MVYYIAMERDLAKAESVFKLYKIDTSIRTGSG